MMKIKRFNNFGILSIVLLAFAMTSCGGSSGGGDSEINFEESYLVNNYWVANEFVSDDYDEDDDLIVYYFERNGDLIKQEYGGREEVEVGSWVLDEETLTITDATFEDGESIDWYLQAETNSTNLVLSASDRRRLNCTTDFSVLEDVFADAFVVNSIDVNGDISRYLQCRVIGENIKLAHMLLASGEDLDLLASDEGTETVFALDDDGISSLESEIFPENDDVRFYIEFDDGTQMKLSDVNDDEEIENLDYEIDYNQGSHIVKWTAIDEDNIYYYVEVLDAKGEIVFRSQSLSADANEVKYTEISTSVDPEFESLDELDVDEQCVVRIIGVKYEDGIDPEQTKYEDYNVQAKTIFSFSTLWS